MKCSLGISNFQWSSSVDNVVLCSSTENKSCPIKLLTKATCKLTVALVLICVLPSESGPPDPLEEGRNLDIREYNMMADTSQKKFT